MTTLEPLIFPKAFISKKLFKIYMKLEGILRVLSFGFKVYLSIFGANLQYGKRKGFVALCD